MSRIAIYDVPFDQSDATKALNDLDRALGGLSIVYYAPIRAIENHFLSLDLDAKEGDVLTSVGSGIGRSVDEALAVILKKIEDKCVASGAPLIVGALTGNRREFTVFGSAELGFAFRGTQSPKLILAMQKYPAA